MKKRLIVLMCCSALLFRGQAQTLSKETLVIETPYGNMRLKLYEETPLHKANFLKLVKEGKLDSLLFHRVINNFMIQGGDPLSKYAKAGDSLGHGDLGYTVPAEFNRQLIHKKGALAAAREADQLNPEFASSASQFYIVMGKVRTAEDLDKYKTRINKTRYTNVAAAFMRSEEGKQLNATYKRLKSENKADSAAALQKNIEGKIKTIYDRQPEYTFDANQVETYTKTGGTPHLDGTYTVFGEVIAGLEIIDKIAQVKTDARDRPLKDIRMRITLQE